MMLFVLLGVGILPILKGQDNGSFMRFQNQFPVALRIVIPDWVTILGYSDDPAFFFFSETPVQWKATTVLSPDRSPRVYNYQEIGIFCKLDVKLDKVSKFPIRFRLGTQEAVDRKEGKY